ncbi:AAA family ATPase [Edaphocola aurantiacus]|uniref:AAA family ATPase n=1 Tax=Edaphocola aurantiacus TaxID=2601682 RepID=UPI001C93E952|nr:MoxR family ATPase [Edaphocola aurantiacus]
MEHQETNHTGTEYKSRLPIDTISVLIDKVKAAIGKTIVGQHEMIELLLTALLAEGHVLLEGVPGVAKTLTAKTMAKLIDAQFSRIQFTPDLMPSDVIGTNIFNPQTTRFEFRQGPIFGNIVLIDEVNRAPAKTQAALFEVMEERQITSDGVTYSLDKPFIVIATQNPIEHEGTYRLPEAQLDRFLFKIVVGYPTIEEELNILSYHHHRGAQPLIAAVAAVLSKEELEQCRTWVQQVHVEEKILQYMAQLVAATRNHPSLYLGGSPRATVALLHAAKALAVLRGRDFVTPEDVTHVLVPALRHRVALTPEKEMEGISADEVLKEMITKVEVPR